MDFNEYCANVHVLRISLIVPYVVVVTCTDMTRLLCMKAALTHTRMLELCFDFNIASARWLIQVATSRDLTKFHSLTFPLLTNVPEVLVCVLELIAENITDFLVFLQRFKESVFEVGKELFCEIGVLVDWQ